jgi:hypothetical protein
MCSSGVKIDPQRRHRDRDRGNRYSVLYINEGCLLFVVPLAPTFTQNQFFLVLFIVD